MTREFVKYEQALALKELGFDKPCLMMYADKGVIYSRGSFGNQWTNNDKGLLTAPLYQQAFRWFREKHGLNSYIYQRSNITYRGVIHKNMKIAVNYTSDSSNYEEAEQACLDKLIEIVKHEDTTR